MSKTCLIMGEPGTGKSTSLRTLNPEETFIINILNKPLPFRGWKTKYNPELKWAEGKNYLACDDYQKILNAITAINNSMPHIKNLVVDDFQYLMANEFMRRATERGFDKFTEIGKHAWEVIMALTQTRDDLCCFVMCHSHTDDHGQTKCKTIGKLLDDKVGLDGIFPVILHTKIINGQYKFLTQHDGSSIARSPIDMFSEQYIDNDLQFVREQMDNFD